MPLIPILPADSQRTVEYKIRLTGQVAEVQADLDKLNLYRAYYEGEHDIPLNEDQQAWLAHVLDDDAPPIDNKCPVAVNKLRARLDVEGFLGPGEDAAAHEGVQPDVDTPTTPAEYCWLWWRANRMDAAERELYTAAIRDGYSFVIVGHNGSRPTLTLAERWDGTLGMRFFWQNERQHQGPLYAVRHWYDVDPSSPTTGGIERVTVYTASAIYKYARPATKEQQASLIVAGRDPDDAAMLQVKDKPTEPWPLPWVDSQQQPLGLPVIPFVSPRGPILRHVIGLQKRINKTWLDIDAAADQLAFGIPVVEYPGSLPKNEESDPAGDGLGMRPGRVMEVGNGASVHKLPADDLTGLLAALREAHVAFAANVEQPIFNFIPLSGEVPSGAALDELNRPLAEQAEEFQPGFSDSWREVFRLAQKLDRLYGEYQQEAVDIVVRWKPQPRSAEAEESEERKQYAAAEGLARALETLMKVPGMALPGALQLLGLDPDSKMYRMLTEQNGEEAAAAANTGNVEA